MGDNYPKPFNRGVEGYGCDKRYAGRATGS